MGKLSIQNWRERPRNARRAGIAVVFDVFRCSTTLHCLLSEPGGHRAAVRIARNLETLATEKREAGRSPLFSEIAREIPCLRRLDNSPTQALEFVADPGSAELSPIVVTTSGTPALLSCDDFEEIWVGSLVGFSALARRLAVDPRDRDVTLLPAAAAADGHVEDLEVAQAFATALSGFCMNEEFVRSCGDTARQRILASPRFADFRESMKRRGLPRDPELCLELDRHAFAARLDFAEKTAFDGAIVRRVEVPRLT